MIPKPHDIISDGPSISSYTDIAKVTTERTAGRTSNLTGRSDFFFLIDMSKSKNKYDAIHEISDT